MTYWIVMPHFQSNFSKNADFSGIGEIRVASMTTETYVTIPGETTCPWSWQ